MRRACLLWRKFAQLDSFIKTNMNNNMNNDNNEPNFFEDEEIPMRELLVEMMRDECADDPNLAQVPDESIDQYLAEELRLIDQTGHFGWEDVEGIHPDIALRLFIAQTDIQFDYGLIEEVEGGENDDDYLFDFVIEDQPR